VSDLLERLRARGWRLTPQRRVVAEVLHGEHVHLSAEAVHGRAQERLPEISLATVYNTLNELVVLGEVQEVTAGEGPKRYDPKVGDRHQHLVCVECKELLDVVPAGEEQLGLPPEEQHGYQILDVKLLFRGVCPACRVAAAAPASAP
jgi:Fur family transcriptional regulator, stress-responsive regulator